ncbi:hypothetical protein ACIO14_18475 [Nocardia fluminea]|uniref:hypothetical protein n=1 Tax=Nocardia fluminea TaxID=134984 RepID=UPI003815316C
MLAAGRWALLVRSTLPLLADRSSLAPGTVLSLARLTRTDSAGHPGPLAGRALLAGALLAGALATGVLLACALLRLALLTAWGSLLTRSRAVLAGTRRSLLLSRTRWVLPRTTGPGLSCLSRTGRTARRIRRRRHRGPPTRRRHHPIGPTLPGGLHPLHRHRGGRRIRRTHRPHRHGLILGSGSGYRRPTGLEFLGRLNVDRLIAPRVTFSRNSTGFPDFGSCRGGSRCGGA